MLYTKQSIFIFGAVKSAKLIPGQSWKQTSRVTKHSYVKNSQNCTKQICILPDGAKHEN